MSKDTKATTPTTVPSMWSTGVPNLQIAWDATSLKALKFCPTYYKNTIVDGWKFLGNVDTEFGGYFASAAETFKRARLGGATKDGATHAALRHVIEATWSADYSGESPGVPWGGHYEGQWRCSGEEPYRNPKGNKAKCPWSHKGKWYPEPSPSVCGSCGSETVVERRWVSDNPAKDRYSLIRLVSWWADEQPEEGGVELYAFPDGTPAVELPFRIVLPWHAPAVGTHEDWTGNEPYILAGYFDSIDQLGEERFISDNKTTKAALGQWYWGGFSPNTQVDVYDLAGSILYPDLNIRGVRIDAAQTMVGGARFGAKVFYRTESQREETLKEIEWWIRQAERYAQEGYWPRNTSNCFNCHFKTICSMEPSKREGYLKGGDFKKEHWNPLAER